MAGGEPTGGDADCAVFSGAVGGGDCGGGKGVVRDEKLKLIDSPHKFLKTNIKK